MSSETVNSKSESFIPTVLGKINKFRKEGDPENVGAKWTDQDKSKLYELLEAGKNHEECALELKRKVGGVITHLKQDAAKMHKAGKDNDEIAKFTKLSIDEIEQAINYKPKGKPVPRDEYDQTIKELKDEIKELKDQIKKLNESMLDSHTRIMDIYGILMKNK